MLASMTFKSEKTPSSKKKLAASASDMTTNEDDLGEEEQGVNATSQGRNTDKPADITGMSMSLRRNSNGLGVGLNSST